MQLESKLDRKIDSYVKGLNYTQCVACDKEAKVEILEDNIGKGASKPNLQGLANRGTDSGLCPTAE